MPNPVSCRQVGTDPTPEEIDLGAAPGDWIVSFDDGTRKAVADQVVRTMSIRPREAW